METKAQRISRVRVAFKPRPMPWYDADAGAVNAQGRTEMAKNGQKANPQYRAAVPNSCPCRWSVQLVQGHEPGCTETFIPAPLTVEPGELPLVQAVTTEDGCFTLHGNREITSGAHIDTLLPDA